LERALQLYAEGKTLLQIAGELGKAKCTIRRALNSSTLYKPRLKGRPRKVAVTQVVPYCEGTTGAKLVDSGAAPLAAPHPEPDSSTPYGSYVSFCIRLGVPPITNEKLWELFSDLYISESVSGCYAAALKAGWIGELAEARRATKKAQRRSAGPVHLMNVHKPLFSGRPVHPSFF
jgi:hypothetical protein